MSKNFLKVRVNVTLSFFNQPKIPLYSEERVLALPESLKRRKQSQEQEKPQQLPEYVPREGTKPPDREILFDENVRHIMPKTVRIWRSHGRPSGWDY